MKVLCLLLVLATAPFLLGGCMSPEDRDFYGRGWINPSELDRPAPHGTPSDIPRVSDPIVDGPTAPAGPTP